VIVNNVLFINSSLFVNQANRSFNGETIAQPNWLITALAALCISPLHILVEWPRPEKAGANQQLPSTLKALARNGCAEAVAVRPD
jgi:hypothetical protein